LAGGTRGQRTTGSPRKIHPFSSVDPPSETLSTLEYAVIIRQFFDAIAITADRAAPVNRSHAYCREVPKAAPICAQLTLRDRRKVDHRSELIALALHRLRDRPQSLQQTFCRQFFGRRRFRVSWAISNDFIALFYAFVADENAPRSGNQLLHLMLSFPRRNTGKNYK
jgi:hypothetical protein